MQSSVFTWARWSVAVSTVLALVAMLLYPGGTAIDGTTRGYSPSRNFLSDLGMTVAYDGRPNRIGATLFTLSVLMLVVGLGAALLVFVKRYAAEPEARRFAYAAGAVGVAASAAFVGVAFTPENRVMDLHVRFTLLAFQLLPVAALFLTLAARRSRAAPMSAVAVWAAMTVALAAYAALLQWGPSLGTPGGLVTFVVAQKAITIVIVLGMAFQVALPEHRRPGGVPV
jgi:hypothetical membrane protein